MILMSTHFHRPCSHCYMLLPHFPLSFTTHVLTISVSFLKCSHYVHHSSSYFFCHDLLYPLYSRQPSQHSHLCSSNRVPTVMEKHGKTILSWKSHGKWAKKIKSWRFKRSWKSHGISPLLIANHAWEIPIIPYRSISLLRSGLAMADFQFMF